MKGRIPNEPLSLYDKSPSDVTRTPVWSGNGSVQPIDTQIDGVPAMWKAYLPKDSLQGDELGLWLGDRYLLKEPEPIGDLGWKLLLTQFRDDLTLYLTPPPPAGTRTEKWHGDGFLFPNVGGTPAVVADGGMTVEVPFAYRAVVPRAAITVSQREARDWNVVDSDTGSPTFNRTFTQVTEPIFMHAFWELRLAAPGGG